MEWNHVGSTLQLISNSTTLPHLVTLFLFVTKPLTKGRRFAERNFGKNGEPTLTENLEAPQNIRKSIFGFRHGGWVHDEGQGVMIAEHIFEWK